MTEKIESETGSPAGENDQRLGRERTAVADSTSVRASVRTLVTVARLECRATLAKRSVVLLGLFLVFSAWRITANTDLQADTPGEMRISGTYSLVHAHGEDPTTAELVFALLSTSWHIHSLTLLVPVFGLLLGLSAIVEKRRLGHLRQYRSYGLSARMLVGGIFLGRAGVLVVFTGLALVTVLVMVLIQSGTGPGLLLLWFAGSVLLFAGVWLSIGIGISVLAPSPRVAVAAGLFTLVSVLFVVNNIVVNVAWLPPDVYIFNPIQSFFITATAQDDTLITNTHLFALGTEGTLFSVAVSTDLHQGITAPRHLRWPVALLVQLGWIVLPLGYAMRRIRTDNSR